MARAAGGLRYVDPRRRRGAVFRTYARLFGTTRLAMWFSRTVLWTVDPHLLRLSRGRLGLAVVDDEQERDRLWELADAMFPPFATYRQRAARTGRTIPILQLLPVEQRSCGSS